MLANVNDANSLAALLEEIGLSGVGVVFADTHIRNTCTVKSGHSVAQTLDAEIKHVVITESNVGYTEFLDTVNSGRGSLKIRAEFHDRAVVIGERTFKVDDDSVHILCKTVYLAKELFGIALNEELLGTFGWNDV